MSAALFLSLTLITTSQDVPTDIPKSELPKSAECIICSANGAGHGEEKPAAGVKYKGKAYFFCNVKEVESFKKDPELYMPPILPRPMPEFGLTDFSGKLWNAESLNQKLVLIDYWATWCEPCKKLMPVLEKLHKKYQPKGFELLSVSIDEKKEDLDKFLAKKKFANPVIHDQSQTYNKWGVRVIPTTFLIKEGQIIGQWTGITKESELDKAISQNLPKE